jgi:peptide chain release factor 3
MVVQHTRLGRTIRMNRPHRLFARERETVDEAYPGDVVGLSNPGLLQIGDTLCVGEPVVFKAIPRFPPERFATLHNTDVGRYKQFNKGLEQLGSEGVVQVLYAADGLRREPILAAVGDLQFDVVESRLQSEYGVKATIERMPYTVARWVEAAPDVLARVQWPTGTLVARDQNDDLVVAFVSEWALQYCARANPAITFRELA